MKENCVSKNLFKNLLRISVILLTLVASPVFAEQKILVLGDSLSAGYGLQENEGWVHLLQEKLNQHPNNISVVNASISGETTAGGASKIKKTLQIHQPDIIIIELGGNDGLQGLSITSMQKNLSNILSTADENNIKTLLVGMKIPPNYGIKYTKKFSESFKKLADQHQSAFVPFLLEGIGGNPLLMQADGIHANAKAQPKILANVWPALSSILKK
jgi:acyl-CoA thioesterase I